MKPDIEIAKDADIKPISDIAHKLGIQDKALEHYGHHKAKINIDLLPDTAHGKLILVTAITPTPAGEGKTTVSIGLTDGLNAIGKKSIAVLREPSLGPVFGIKGGAAGGGYSQVIPMEDINLHFTGDFAAIEASNNLLSALIDNNIQSNKADRRIDPRTVTWKRVLDMNDRALRNIIVGLGGRTGGIARESGFYITAASEVMAILCLANGFSDLKERLASIYVGDDYDGEPVYARDLKAENAMALLLKDAIKPNLVQTLEGNPAILHGGPFANIAQGTNSAIATKTGIKLADYVVTEAGFGADLGAEKFLNIKCRSAKLNPAAIVVVATVRALKMHGGRKLDELKKEDTEALKSGLPNLEKHIENMRSFGKEVVVAINTFPDDTEAEHDIIKEFCKDKGVGCAVCKGFAEGGEGMRQLAEQVVMACDSDKAEADLQHTYQLISAPEDKIRTIAQKIYGAKDIELQPKAKKDLAKIKALGAQDLPICMAKTQYSFSDDPKKLGRPDDFVIGIREIEVATGAGFIIPITGMMLRMPGLPSKPAAEGMHINGEGNISGLS
jgi:formate--tetrahydrofolate ligase